jgi:hypothetical protein
MARVPLPERGQPLDVSYIYSLAQAINDIAVQVNQDSSNFSTVYSSGMGNQNLKTGDARFVGTTQQVVSGENVIAGNTKDLTYNFPSDFKYIPIVTISPLNVGKNDAGSNVTVSLKEVTTSRVDYTVRYNTTGTISLSVNIITIGIPN